jgi:ABC-type branched-subunit amino acid transport system ATPase component
MGRTFQAPRPFPEWTVRENVALAAERRGAPVDVEKLLQELDLSALSGRPAGQLSVGEGKRLELARVLALEPALLLLDEPLAGLSPAAAERVSGAIERRRREGAAVVWVEHGPAAGDLASQLLVLEGGQMRFLGSPSDWEATREAPS